MRWTLTGRRRAYTFPPHRPSQCAVGHVLISGLWRGCMWSPAKAGPARRRWLPLWPSRWPTRASGSCWSRWKAARGSRSSSTYRRCRTSNARSPWDPRGRGVRAGRGHRGRPAGVPGHVLPPRPSREGARQGGCRRLRHHHRARTARRAAHGKVYEATRRKAHGRLGTTPSYWTRLPPEGRPVPEHDRGSPGWPRSGRSRDPGRRDHGHPPLWTSRFQVRLVTLLERMYPVQEDPGRRSSSSSRSISAVFRSIVVDIVRRGPLDDDALALQ